MKANPPSLETPSIAEENIERVVSEISIAPSPMLSLAIEITNLEGWQAEPMSVPPRVETPPKSPEANPASPTLQEWKTNLPAMTARDLIASEPSPTSGLEELNPAATPELQRLQQEFLVPEPNVVQDTASGFSPGVSISTPIGFGASFGQFYGGLGFQARTRYTNSADGSLAIGGGLGDPQKYVGADLNLAILSIFGDDAFGRGGISLKIHRLLPEDFAIALGFENAVQWGESDAGSSIYGVVSKFFRLKNDPEEPFSQLTLSLGLGGGRFRSENDVLNGNGSVNVFASAGLRVLEPMSAILEWSGQDLNAGISVVPFAKLPLTINLAGADLTGNAGDGARFIMSIGYNYSFTPSR